MENNPVGKITGNIDSEIVPIGGNAILNGIKLFFFDSGITISFSIIVGTILGAAHVPAAQIKDSSILVVIGIIFSVYAAYILYRQYSKDIIALVTLIITYILFSSLAIYILFASKQNYSKEIFSSIAGIVAYLIGWYLAKVTKTKFPLLPRGWNLAFIIIGIIATFVSVLALIHIVTA